MNKIFVKIVVAMLFIYSSLTANEIAEYKDKKEAWYVGIGKVFSGSGTHKNTYELDGLSNIDDRIGIDFDSMKFKAGYDNDGFRFEMAYSSNKVMNKNYKDEHNFKGIDLDIANTFTEYKIKPFITGGVGIHIWDKLKVQVGDTSETRNRKAISVNYGAGFLYRYQMIELELAYKGKYYMWEAVHNSDETIELQSETSVHGLYLGANIRF